MCCCCAVVLCAALSLRGLYYWVFLLLERGRRLNDYARPELAPSPVDGPGIATIALLEAIARSAIYKIGPL
jgi:hypothetical protein